MNIGMKVVFVMALSLAGLASADESPPYAGEESREIKALSKPEIDGLLSGKGMGYGKAAELNGYPGPAHVLELGGELSLSASQRQQTEIVFGQMEAAAKDLGADLVAAEHALDQAFKSKKIDESSLSGLVKNIGEAESRLRVVHLNAHLQQTEILNDQQISKYMALRGYSRAGHRDHHKHPHRKWKLTKQCSRQVRDCGVIPQRGFCGLNNFHPRSRVEIHKNGAEAEPGRRPASEKRDRFI